MSVDPYDDLPLRSGEVRIGVAYSGICGSELHLATDPIGFGVAEGEVVYPGHEYSGVIVETGADVEYRIGTMIELPRAALTADEIASKAEFFSFGTNDLTQTTFGLSRDDAGKFLPNYVERGILPDDPFQVLDRRGVGGLMRQAVALGRGVREKMKIGICGEHGGEPSSVAFCGVRSLAPSMCQKNVPLRYSARSLRDGSSVTGDTSG